MCVHNVFVVLFSARGKPNTSGLLEVEAFSFCVVAATSWPTKTEHHVNKDGFRVILLSRARKVRWWKQKLIFDIFSFSPPDSKMEGSSQIDFQEDYRMLEANNETHSRVIVMKNNIKAYEEKAISDEFSLTLGEQLAILVSLWIFASLISILVWPCTPIRKAVGLDKREEEKSSWTSWGWSWVSLSAWQEWWYRDQHS